ncbi:MAG: 5'-methylthioadenosine/adenosylhomocysteine nucleosidase [Clostridia bacterium]|nr:5'-methylthioadenosine/adenosylhomocysteine nucleosidase [Clostridia bacterium]MBO7170268.1 5'-methylthioadenosine/adenosylhomocysteine nucleosidase [Clostridia bacterium]
MIGIIAAMTVELEKLKEAATVTREETVSGLTFTLGVLEGKEVVMTVCGEGKVNAALSAEAMLLRYAPTLLINTGVAGALSETLSVPDVAVATAVCQHDYDISPLGYQKGQVLFPGGSATFFETDGKAASAFTAAAKEAGVHTESGVIASGDIFVAEEGLKTAIRQGFSAIACEMEGGAIGHVAFLNQTPFAVIRAISDGADDATAFDPVRAAAISVDITRRALTML